MGLIDFVKSAGAKLLGRDDEKAVEEQLAAQPPADSAMEAMRENLRLRKMEGRLKQAVDGLGLEASSLEIHYDGETVVLGGEVETQELREKIVLVVGNHEGISSVDDQIEVTNPEPEAVFYTVRSGDTLGKIAKEHYGNAGKYPVIFEANRPMLENPDKIYPGQVLRIPALPDS
jgi:nucleoid-associated protein YgaU